VTRALFIIAALGSNGNIVFSIFARFTVYLLGLLITPKLLHLA